MDKHKKEFLEEKHNVYIDEKCELFNVNDTENGWQPIPKDWILCAHCGRYEVDFKNIIAADEQLCFDCLNELSGNDKDNFIGYRKGE